MNKKKPENLSSLGVPAEPEKPKTEKPKASKKAKGNYVGTELTVKLSSGNEYTGLCVSERKTNDGSQVFLKIPGKVSRFFSAKDIVK